MSNARNSDRFHVMQRLPYGTCLEGLYAGLAHHSWQEQLAYPTHRSGSRLNTKNIIILFLSQQQP